MEGNSTYNSALQAAQEMEKINEQLSSVLSKLEDSG